MATRPKRQPPPRSPNPHQNKVGKKNKKRNGVDHGERTNSKDESQAMNTPVQSPTRTPKSTPQRETSPESSPASSTDDMKQVATKKNKIVQSPKGPINYSPRKENTPSSQQEEDLKPAAKPTNNAPTSPKNKSSSLKQTSNSPTKGKENEVDAKKAEEEAIAMVKAIEDLVPRGCMAEFCISSSPSASIQSCTNLFCDTVLHSCCGKLHHGQLFCLRCYNRTAHHMKCTTPITTDYEALRDANPVDIIETIMYIQTCWPEKDNRFPFFPHQVLQYYEWWIAYGQNYATESAMWKDRVNPQEITNTLKKATKHYYPYYKQGTIYKQIKNPWTKGSNAENKETEIKAPPPVERYVGTDNNFTDTHPYLATIDIENDGFQGRMRCLTRITQGLSNGIFKEVNDMVTAQALLNLAGTSIEFHEVSTEIKKKLFELAVAQLTYEETTPDPSKALLSLLMTLGKKSEVDHSISTRAERCEMVKTCLRKIKLYPPSTDRIDNATWQALNKQTGVYLPPGLKQSPLVKQQLQHALNKFQKIPPLLDEYDGYTINILNSYCIQQEKTLNENEKKGKEKTNSVSFNEEVTTKVIPNTREDVVHRFDLHLTIARTNQPAYNTSHVWHTIVSFVDKLTEIDPTVEVLPWMTVGEQTPLTKHKEVKNLDYIHRFFPRVVAADMGKTWSEIRIRHQRKWDDIKQEMIPWLQEKTHGFYIKTLQAEVTRVAGWLLYSHRAINLAVLAEAFHTKYGIQVAFRYQNVSTGTISTPENQTVQALHVVAAMADVEHIKSIFQAVYGSNAKVFPFGVRMRFVPWIAWNNKPRIEQVMELRDRQAVFNLKVTQMASWEISSLDKNKAGMITLREMIMGLQSKLFPGTPVFLSIDRAWNNPGIHVFAFMDRVEDEARQAVTTILPLLKHLYKDDVELYFTEQAKTRAAGTMWDEEKQKVITVDEQYFNTVIELAQDDDEWFGLTVHTNPNQHPIVDLTPATATTPSSIRMQNIYYGDEKDSVGTVRTGATGPHLTGDIQIPDEGSNGGRTASITIGTVESRVSHMEAHIQGLANEFKNMNSNIVTVIQKELRNALLFIRNQDQESNDDTGIEKEVSTPKAGATTMSETMDSSEVFPATGTPFITLDGQGLSGAIK